MKTTWRRNLLTCISVGLIGLIATAGAGADDEPEEGAWYDYRRWECRVDGNSFTLSVSHKITIFNKRGEGYARLSFSDDSHSKLKSVEIQLRDADGEVVYERDNVQSSALSILN
jgi:hypothetical protein